VRNPKDPIIAKREAMNTKKPSTPLRSTFIRANKMATLATMTKRAYVVPGNKKDETRNGEL